MSAGDHGPRRSGSSMYHHGPDQQYYFLRDLDDEPDTGFSFPSGHEMISSHHDTTNTLSSISTNTAALMPLIFDDGGLTINELPNYTTTTTATTNNVNSFFTSIFPDYGLIRQPATADLYDLQLGSGSQRVNNYGRIISSIMDTNASTSAAAAGGGGAMTSGTATPLTGNSSISSPSTEDEDAATEDQEDLSSSSRVLACNNNTTTSTINKGDSVDHMDAEEQRMDTKGDNENDDDTAAAAGGDKSKKLLSKPRKKGEKRQREPRFAFMTKSDVDHLEDGYRWRKYGQKAVKNSPYPRSYYRCTTQKCSVKKRVERSYHDPSIVITTYEGQHTHQSPATVRGSSHIWAPPPPSTLTMPLYSSFHRENNHVLQLHQLMNPARTRELETAAMGAVFNPSSIIRDTNASYLQSLMSASDPSLQRQQLHQLLLPTAAADDYGLLQDHVAIPSSFNINSSGPLP